MLYYYTETYFIKDHLSFDTHKVLLRKYFECTQVSLGLRSSENASEYKSSRFLSSPTFLRASLQEVGVYISIYYL